VSVVANADFFHVNPEPATNNGQIMRGYQATFNEIADGIGQVSQTLVDWLGMSSAEADAIRKEALSISNDFGIFANLHGTEQIKGVDHWVSTDQAAARRIAS
jgi:hypothetical protein